MYVFKDKATSVRKNTIQLTFLLLLWQLRRGTRTAVEEQLREYAMHFLRAMHVAKWMLLFNWNFTWQHLMM